MKLQHYLILFLAIAMFSCHKEEPPVVAPPTPPVNVYDPTESGPPIYFDSLAIGQISKYLVLTVKGYNSSQNNQIEYSDDTVQLKIVAKDNLGFKVEEKLFYTGDTHEWLKDFKDSTLVFYLNIVNDTLVATAEPGEQLYSRLLRYYAGDGRLPLADIPGPLAEITGWKTDLPYCECDKQAYAENYTFMGKNYDRLNILILNHDMASDGNGRTYMYNKKELVRFSYYSWWTQSGYGLDLIAE